MQSSVIFSFFRVKDRQGKLRRAAFSPRTLSGWPGQVKKFGGVSA